MTEVPFTPLIINGEERPASNAETFEVHQPHSGKLAGTAASASSQDCRDAIEAASQAFKSWEKTSPAARRDVLLKAADLFTSDKYRQPLIDAFDEETALPSFFVALQLFGAGPSLKTLAGLIEKLKGEYFPSVVAPGAHVYVQKRAKGVLLAIVPWNAPVVLTIRAVAIPLLCGNTIVLKGSELSPRSFYLVTKLFHDAGLPNGVLNCISISRENTPPLISEIIAHRRIRHINFTGSEKVGKVIAMEAAKHLKPCVLELGGKAPTIVMNDANIEEAAKAIVFGAMASSGQICMSTERVIVQTQVSDRLISTIRNICQKIRAADFSTDPQAQLGPVFSEASAERIIQMIKDAQEGGSEVLLGDLQRDKAIVQPHLVKNVKPGMSLWEEESFGPVIAFATFETTEEAIELANASEYSLTSSVWTADLSLAQEIAFQLNYGYVHINGSTVHTEPTDSLLGLGGASGYGRFDVDHYTDKRTTVVHTKSRKYPGVVTDDMVA